VKRDRLLHESQIDAISMAKPSQQPLSRLLALFIASQSGLCALAEAEPLALVAAGDLQLTLRSVAGGLRIDRLLATQSGQRNSSPRIRSSCSRSRCVNPARPTRSA
jgi:hypothetical protein